jgi:hypothetical protein
MYHLGKVLKDKESKKLGPLLVLSALKKFVSFAKLDDEKVLRSWRLQAGCPRSRKRSKSSDQ